MSLLDDYKKLRRDVARLTKVIMKMAGSSGVSDHGALTGLADDDHTQYLLADGTRAVSGTLAGVTPTADAHLATKKYIDDKKLDDAAAPDDNTDNDASTAKHGLLKKLDGDTTHFLRGDGAFAVPPGSGNRDPRIVLLMHGDGADGSTVITDETGKTGIIVNGDAQIDTSEKKFGTGSILFDGNGDYINWQASYDFCFMKDDFTIDFWVYPTSFGADAALVDLLQLSGGGARYDSFVLIQNATDGKLKLYRNGGYGSSTSGVLTINTWNHVAIENIKGVFTYFINGTKDATTDTISPITSGGLVIGRYADSAGGWFTGRIEEFRVYKGVAVWTADFTPPTVPYA